MKKNVVVGIDPATLCGFCVLEMDGSIAEVFEMNLANECKAKRAHELIKIIRILNDNYKIEMICFESVFGHSRHAIKILERLAGVIIAVSEIYCLPYCEVPVTKLKLYATGTGKASKQQMIDEAKKVTGREAFTDNEADAYFIARYGLAQTT